MREVDETGFPSDRGICDRCERLPISEGDIFCPMCRLEVEAMSEIISDPVELALSAHWHVCPLSDSNRTMCRCGKVFEGGPGNHRRHVAEVIRSALGLEPPAPWRPAVLPEETNP